MFGWLRKQKKMTDAERLEVIRAKAQSFSDAHIAEFKIDERDKHPGITVGEYVDPDAMWRHLSGRDQAHNKRGG